MKKISFFKFPFSRVSPSSYSPHPNPLLGGEGVKEERIILPSPSRRRVGYEVSAFTLIELIISITILSVMLLSIFEVYNNILQINKRLEVMRIVQENVRNITEQIATDIREKGIDFNYYTSTTEGNNYTGSGNTLLAIYGNEQYFAMKENTTGTIEQCKDVDLQNPLTHCYIGRKSGSTYKYLSDKRVRVENIRFFLSGNPSNTLTNESQEGKATIILTLRIENTAGVSSEIAKSSQMTIQTTISEKAYKKE